MDEVFEFVVELIVELFGDGVLYEVDNWLQKIIQNRVARRIVYILISLILFVLVAAIIIALFLLIEFLWHQLTGK